MFYEDFGIVLPYFILSIFYQICFWLLLLQFYNILINKLKITELNTVIFYEKFVDQT